MGSELRVSLEVLLQRAQAGGLTVDMSQAGGWVGEDSTAVAAHSPVNARMMWGGRCDGSCQLAGVSAVAVWFGGDLLLQWTIFVLMGSGEGLRQSCSSVSAAATVLQHSTIALTLPYQLLDNKTLRGSLPTAQENYSRLVQYCTVHNSTVSKENSTT